MTKQLTIAQAGALHALSRAQRAALLRIAEPAPPVLYAKGSLFCSRPGVSAAGLRMLAGLGLVNVVDARLVLSDRGRALIPYLGAGGGGERSGDRRPNLRSVGM